MLPINRHPGAKELRAFTRIWFPLFVLLFGGMIWWRAGSLMGAVITWSVGGALLAAALASANVARIVFVGLVTVTYPIGLAISTVVLALMFYVVFTPFGFVMRLAGRDPLRLKQRNAASNWTPYHQIDDPEQAFRQY
jgi:hypothetical protein